MGLIAEHRVTDIIIMRGLYVVEQNHVLQFAGIADHRVFSDDGAASDEGAVPDLGAVVNDAGRADVGRGKHLRVVCDPDSVRGMGIFVGRQGLTQLQNKVLDPVQNLPGVGLAFKQIGGDGLAQIKQFIDGYHSFVLLARMLTSHGSDARPPSWPQ